MKAGNNFFEVTEARVQGERNSVRQDLWKGYGLKRIVVARRSSKRGPFYIIKTEQPTYETRTLVYHLPAMVATLSHRVRSLFLVDPSD